MEFTVFDLVAQRTGTPHAATYQHAIEQARIADQGGLDCYYVTEHHFNPDFQIVPSPHLAIAALAQHTERIRLGTMCTNLPMHHPVRVAEEIRMMDLLTEGRLEMGFGRGAQEHEQLGFGVARAEAEHLFDDALELVKHLLTTQRVEHYRAGPWSGSGVVIVPEATQRPHPPMWMTAVSEKSLRKAGRLGLNLCTAFLNADQVARTLASYGEAWEDARPGTPRGKYGALHHIFVAETEAEARTYARPHIEGWLETWLQIVSDKPKDNVDRGYEEHAAFYKAIASTAFDEAIASDMVIFGTPDHCVEQLLRQADLGVDMFQGWFQFGGLDYEASNRSLRLFCEEVAPRVRAALGAPRTAVPAAGQ